MAADSRSVEEAGFDPNAVANLGEAEGDSLGHVELIMAFEEAFNIELKIDSPSKEDSLR